MLEKIKDDIARFGCSILAVPETDYLPSFAFTLGLQASWQHPELICFGLPVSTLQQVLQTAADLVRDGQRLNPGERYDDFFETGEVIALAVDPANTDDYFGYALDYYGTDTLPALQLVWQDRRQRFPWETGFETEFRYRQPLLDRNMNFRFSEPEQLEVYTTPQFLEGAAITQVIHDQAGSWHFLSAGAEHAAPCMLPLADIIAKDPSLNRLFNLDLGEMALRQPDGRWLRQVQDEA